MMNLIDKIPEWVSDTVAFVICIILVVVFA